MEEECPGEGLARDEAAEGRRKHEREDFSKFRARERISVHHINTLSTRAVVAADDAEGAAGNEFGEK